jgi:hypothetical protein
MMRCTKMFSLVALTSAFAGGLAFVSLTNTATAEDAMPDLCVAVGATIDLELAIGGCLYSSTEATYNVKYGEVINPLSNEVIGYAPLPDACELVPCEPSDYNSQALVDGVACCDPNTGECTAPDANGNCIGGEITWCKEIEVNSEGNLICHE